MPYESEEVVDLQSLAYAIEKCETKELPEKCSVFARKSQQIPFEEFMYASANNAFDLIKTAEKIRSIPMFRCRDDLSTFCNVNGEMLGDVLFCGNWREIIAQKSVNAYK